MNVKKKLLMILTVSLTVMILFGTITLGYLLRTGWLATAQVFKEAEDGQIRIACVGDSITYGAGVIGWPQKSYPNVLNDLLGDEYVVNNYGYSGRTAMFSGDSPYVDDETYTQSLDFQPDIVIIMLGTNDSKPKNWKGKDAYIEDYSKIIDSYLALASTPEVYIIAPPPVFEIRGIVKFTIDSVLVDGDIYNAVVEIAAEKGLHFIDMHAVFEGKSQLFPDGVHPTAEGARLFAEAVYSSMMC